MGRLASGQTTTTNSNPGARAWPLYSLNGLSSDLEMKTGRDICSGRLTIAVLSLLLAGCNNQPPVAQGPPASQVTVGRPEQKEVVNWNEFTGGTAAVKLVNVTPRVSGYIVDIPFKEGDIVHKGDLLFQIDPRPYQDAHDQAVGQLQRAQASQKLQDITFERRERLQSTGVIAKEDYDTALANKIIPDAVVMA